MKSRAKRISVNLVAELISNAGMSASFIKRPAEDNGTLFYAYAGMIADLSEGGLKLIMPADKDTNIKKDSQYDIGFQLPTGKRVSLHCEVKWQDYKTSFYGLSHCIGMEILEPPPEYKSFFKNIADDNAANESR